MLLYCWWFVLKFALIASHAKFKLPSCYYQWFKIKNTITNQDKLWRGMDMDIISKEKKNSTKWELQEYVYILPKTHFALYRNNFLRTSRLKPRHCIKSVCIWTYSGPHFFRIRAEYREILGKIIENMGKMQTRITPFSTVLVRLRLYPAQFSFNYFVRNYQKCVLERLKCNFFWRLWEPLTLTKRFQLFHFYKHLGPIQRQ